MAQSNSFYRSVDNWISWDGGRVGDTIHNGGCIGIETYGVLLSNINLAANWKEIFMKFGSSQIFLS